MPGVAAAQQEIAYSVTIVGADDDELQDLLEQSSQLVELKDRPPGSVARLRVRANGDVERLTKTLRSQGYYDGKVEVALDAQAQPATVSLLVAPGPVYALAGFTARFKGGPPLAAEQMPLLSKVGLATGTPAQAAAILSAESQVVAHLRQNGFPLAKRLGHEALLYRDSRTLKVAVDIDPGPRARFGKVVVDGLELVELAHVRRQIPWRTGERYDERLVQQARRKLSADPLFGSAAVSPAGQVNPDGTVDVAVSLREADRRSIGAGVSYSTDIGPGANVFWEHRNLFGEGEKLRLSLSAALNEQVAEANYTDASVGDGRYTLFSDFSLENRMLDAYDERAATLTTALQWSLGDYWTTRAGISLELQEIEDETDPEPQQFFLVGLPLSVNRDDTDDRLNPTRGSRLSVSLTPYAGAGTRFVNFVSATLGGSAYYGIDPDGRFVLAGRARVGSLVGEPVADIPADKRFYAGGGGSIRGYEFQSVGPLDSDNDPTGGRSLLEFSGELRIRLTDTIGIVPFVDAGTVAESEYPTLEEELQWAAGLGLRYYTAIGPLRADIAVPLNKRDFDDEFQFYVSLGQSF
ncbi:MAG: autotransporter assembly complex family protein [Alphaproteobacteria bacterium]